MPRSKLSDSQIRALRERAGRGERQAALAREYGVTRMSISLIVAGKRRTPAAPADDGMYRERAGPTFLGRVSTAFTGRLFTRPGGYRLRTAEVRSIRRRLVAGETRASLASEYSTSYAMVVAIGLGRSYPSAGGPEVPPTRSRPCRPASTQRTAIIEALRDPSRGTFAEIASELGVTKAVVAGVAHRTAEFDGKNWRPRRLSIGTVLAIKQRILAQDATLEGLAREFGITIGTIKDIAYGKTWRHIVPAGATQDAFRPRQPHGPKLTEAGVVAIKQAIAAGQPQDSIAQRFGIRRQQVSHIATGKAWGYVAADPETDQILLARREHLKARKNYRPPSDPKA